MQRRWNEMILNEKREYVLAYWRAKAASQTQGIEERKYVLKQVFFAQELESPEIEGYLERMYIKITGGTEC